MADRETKSYTTRNSKKLSENTDHDIAETVMTNLLKSQKFLDTLESVCRQTMEKVVCARFAELQQQIDKNEATILDLQNTLDTKTKEIKSLKQRFTDESEKREITERKLNDLEQYTRRNSIRIFGVREQTNEDTDQIAIDLAREKLGFALSKTDIDRSHRVYQKDQTKAKPIIVKLCAHNVKSLFMRNKKRLKDTGVSIQEDLTKPTVILLRKTSDHQKVQAAWTTDGRVFAAVKTNDEHKTIKKRIFRESDLANL